MKHVSGQKSVNGLVAAALGVSESWLSHQLKQHTDRSFREHLTDLRLTDAERLLRHPSLSLKECGLTAGFPTANAFTTAFRRRFGLSPREWRRTQGAGED